jgi:hypothetical protein
LFPTHAPSDSPRVPRRGPRRDEASPTKPSDSTAAPPLPLPRRHATPRHASRSESKPKIFCHPFSSRSGYKRPDTHRACHEFAPSPLVTNHSHPSSFVLFAIPVVLEVMSAPRTSISHRRHAAGVSTPFPITAAKFEYPVNEHTVNEHTISNSHVTSSARERREFAASLQRALRNIRGPFTLNKTPKIPPSILARKNSANTASSPLFASGDVSTLRTPETVREAHRTDPLLQNSYVSPESSPGLGFDVRRRSHDIHRVVLTSKASCATL